MDHVLIVVVNEGLTPAAATPFGVLPFPGSSKKHISVWRAVRKGARARASWHVMGLATAFATSLAAWVVVALAVTHFVK